MPKKSSFGICILISKAFIVPLQYKHCRTHFDPDSPSHLQRQTQSPCIPCSFLAICSHTFATRPSQGHIVLDPVQRTCLLHPRVLLLRRRLSDPGRRIQDLWTRRTVDPILRDHSEVWREIIGGVELLVRRREKE